MAASYKEVEDLLSKAHMTNELETCHLVIEPEEEVAEKDETLGLQQSSRYQFVAQKDANSLIRDDIRFCAEKKDSGKLTIQSQQRSMLQCSCFSYCFPQAVVDNFCPPRGHLGFLVTGTFVTVSLWATLWSVVGKDALPGGNIFSLYVLLVASAIGGLLLALVKFFRLPPLLGMLIVGFLLGNVPGISVAKDISKPWSSSLRSVALVVILIRSGLGLDIVALKRLKFTVIRLAFGPCVAEAVAVAFAAHLLLRMPLLWSFQLGFILAAVSPAVVVPSMLDLQMNGFGIEKGIPTMIMAASSCDDVLAISLFGVFLGIAFSEGNLVFNIFRGPIELLIGILVGLTAGVTMWYFPYRKLKAVNGIRTVFLLSLGLLSVFGSNRAEFSGAGALAALSMAATAGYGWGEDGKAAVEHVMGLLWTIFQPLLFGLIGAEVSINYMEKDLIGLSLAALAVGLIVRLCVTYLVVYGSNFTRREKLFCALAWLPKATVQAAIGTIPVDTARNRGFTGKSQELLGIQIVTIAVLAILITAPAGAIAISMTGPRWLMRRETSTLDSGLELRMRLPSTSKDEPGEERLLAGQSSSS